MSYLYVCCTMDSIKRDGFVSWVFIEHHQWWWWWWWQDWKPAFGKGETRWIKPNTIETNIYLCGVIVSIYLLSVFTKLLFHFKVVEQTFEQWTLWDKKRPEKENESEFRHHWSKRNWYVASTLLENLRILDSVKLNFRPRAQGLG
jgi:hypothetical protein